MKILFAPSEMKSSVLGTTKFDLNNFIFPNLKDKRKYALKQYENFINSSSNAKLHNFFGVKDEDSLKYYKKSFQSEFGIKAILRYEGVAYKALDYRNLDKSVQKYIDENVIIFSNLYGPILAGTSSLPDYKFKQGQKIDNFQIEQFYKENFSDTLDEFLKDEDILDIRAGYYEKFYTIKKDFLTLKFIKDGKVVSHYAKHYRGIVLKELAKSKVSNFSEFENLRFENLKLIDIKQLKNKKEFLFEIV